MTLLDRIQLWIGKFQASLGPLNDLPTELNEPLTPIVVMPPMIWGLGIWALPVFLVLSHLYEKFLDPWGDDAKDTLWRAYGAVLVQLVWLWLR